MSQRTQMRLQAISGSLVAIHNESTGSIAAAPADIAAGSLLDILGEVAGSIKRIHGASTFTQQESGVFTHDRSSFSGRLETSGSFDVAGAVNLQSTLTVEGAMDLQSTLTVADTVDFKGDLLVSGALKVEDLTPTHLVFVGADDVLSGSGDLTFASGQLKVEGIVSGSGDFLVGEDLVVDKTSTLYGNVDALSGLDVTGANLTVGGVNFSVNVTNGDVTSAGNINAVSGSFSGDITVTGDLIVNGTTTTINSTIVTVDDKAIELGSTQTPTDTTADGGGIILKGATDKTILWSNQSGEWEISDGIVVDGSGSFTGDLAVTGSGSFTGDLNVDGVLTVGSFKIDNDTATRLYIVDADGSMKDETKLTFDGTELKVDGALEVVNAADFKSDVMVTGSLLVQSGSVTVGLKNKDFSISSVEHDGSVYIGQNNDYVATFTLDAGSSTLHGRGGMTMTSGDWINIDAAGYVRIEGSADSYLKIDGGNKLLLQTLGGGLLDVSSDGALALSGSAGVKLKSATGEIKFADQYTSAVGSTWNDSEGIKLSNSAADWANFEATFGSEVSLLAALVGGGSGGKFKADIVSTSAFVTSSILTDVHSGANFADKWNSIVEPKISKVDIFVNGQLMVSGTEIGSPSGVMDYAIASNGDITFGFDLVADDIVMALIR